MRYLPLMLPLAACATPAVRVETQRVEIPVPVACIDRDKVPAIVAPTGKLPMDARQAADALAAKVLELRGTDRELRALVGGCLR